MGGGGVGSWVGGGGGLGLGVIVNEVLKFLGKFKKKFREGGFGGSGWVGGQGGCGRRIEVFVKIQKTLWGGSGSGRGCRVSGWM